MAVKTPVPGTGKQGSCLSFMGMRDSAGTLLVRDGLLVLL